MFHGISDNQRKRLNVQSPDMLRKVIGIVMTQMSKHDKYAQVSVKEGIQRHGQKAIDAVLTEYAQLNDRNILEPKHAHELDKEAKREALNLIKLVKGKRCRKIKGRACADGRKQRRYITKEEVASPTVQLNSLLLTLLMDAQEHRDVATADVVGAYLMAPLSDFVLVKIMGNSVDIMCQVQPAYQDYVVNEKGKKVLYLQLTKALYGCMQSALLWHNTFSSRLKQMDFRLNPYDSCVANKKINGSQCTICWYVDDVKISHVEGDVVSNIIKRLEETFGKMTVTRGRRHTFVGMDIEFKDDGTVYLTMNEYIKECVDTYRDQIKHVVATPAKGTLFDEDVGIASNLIPDEQADKFHHTMAKLLFAAKRVRLDIDLAVSFLCTRVANPTVGDEEKLIRTLEYLEGTPELPRIMGSDGRMFMQHWVDVSYGIHVICVDIMEGQRVWVVE